MLGIGDKLPEFSVTGVKPGFNEIVENGEEAFETLTEKSFEGKWKVIFFYPKDFTFVCPTEIAEFARLNEEFEDRDCSGSWAVPPTTNSASWLGVVIIRISTNCQSGCLPTPTAPSLMALACVTRTALPTVTPMLWIAENTIQHVYATNLNVGRNPKDTLRVLDALQTDELCPCNREVGGNDPRLSLNRYKHRMGQAPHPHL